MCENNISRPRKKNVYTYKIYKQLKKKILIINKNRCVVHKRKMYIIRQCMCKHTHLYIYI